MQVIFNTSYMSRKTCVVYDKFGLRNQTVCGSIDSFVGSSISATYGYQHGRDEQIRLDTETHRSKVLG
jgi:hypothetical protein